MDSRKFVEMLGLMPEGRCPEEVVEAVREQLENAGRHWYQDVSGDGTRYETNGRRHGVAFARGIVELRPDGNAVVRVETGQRVAPELERAARKLFSYYSSRFKVPGLAVDDGRVIFETEPFDPLNGRFEVETVVGLALSTVHAYGGVMLALDAGVDPWTLLDYDDDDDDDDDDDGESAPPLPRLSDEARSELERQIRERLDALGAGRGEGAKTTETCA